MLELKTVSYLEFKGSLVAGTLNEGDDKGFYVFTHFIKTHKKGQLKLTHSDLETIIRAIRKYRETKNVSYLSPMGGVVLIPEDKADELEKELVILSSNWSEKIN